MHHAKASWLAWTLCALVSALTGIGLALTFAGPDAPRSAAVFTQTVLEAILPVVFGVVGALIVARQPRNTIGWLLMVIALAWTMGGVPAGYLPYAIAASPEPSVAILVMVWFVGWSWWLLIGPLLLILVLFPTGRPPAPRWRWVIVAVAALFGTFLVLVTFSETVEAPEYNVRFPNPLGIIPDRVLLLVFGLPWTTMLLTTATGCVAAVFVRYRRAAAHERAQIKWFLYACAVFLLIYVITGFLADTTTDTIVDVWFGIVFDLALLTIPTSIGIAILRYRLYDIDVIIQRTLIYSVLTALLALIYGGSVVVLQAVLRPLVGAETELATIASTLAIAALFQPLRRRIQAGIDRRFYRRKYDAQQTLQAFSARLRDEPNLDELAEDMLRVVQATVQPAHSSLWLREGSLHAREQPAEAQ